MMLLYEAVCNVMVAAQDKPGLALNKNAAQREQTCCTDTPP